MKQAIKQITNWCTANDAIYSILDSTINRASGFIQCSRKIKLDKSKFSPESEIIKISPTLTVLHGPFKGMQYPQLKSAGSTLSPKIIGSYERELHQIMNIICKTQYTEIVDIGCAEGYYAVGLAMRIADATILAFDTDSNARQLCKTMAIHNNVSNNVKVGAQCDADLLAILPYTKKALIICDCEGYEKSLFTPKNLPALANHDLLIETHDFIDIDISTHLKELFSKTHVIQAIQSMDDIQKARCWSYDELSSYTLAEKRILLGEFRPNIMEWLFMTPIKQQGAG